MTKKSALFSLLPLPMSVPLFLYFFARRTLLIANAICFCFFNFFSKLRAKMALNLSLTCISRTYGDYDILKFYIYAVLCPSNFNCLFLPVHADLSICQISPKSEKIPDFDDAPPCKQTIDSYTCVRANFRRFKFKCSRFGMCFK